MPIRIRVGPWLRQSIRLKLAAMALIPLLIVLPVLILLMLRWGESFFNSLLVYKVNSDLLVAHQYFERTRTDVASRIAQEAVANRIVTAVVRGNRRNLAAVIAAARTTAGLDFLHVLDLRGRVLAGANDEQPGADWQAWKVVQAAADGQASASVDVFSNQQLARLSPRLARQAILPLLPTQNAAPSNRRIETRGMVLQAAAPIYDAQGRIRAILHGGVLLNRNLAFIDTLNRIVYQAASLPSGSKGTATLFLDDERIATNVRLFQGQRALGTRVSQEVRDQVLGRGQPWLNRAFVVNDWYMSGYEPIVDSQGTRIGMLYVGYLVRPFDQMAELAMGILIGLFVLVSLFGSFLSLEWGGRLIQPLERMVATMRRVRAGDAAARVGPVASEDEIGQLAGQFDVLLDTLQARNAELQQWADALDRKVAERTAALEEANRHLQAAQRQLVLSEKLAAIGQLTAGVAHEINNPVAVIQGNLDVARDVLGDATAPVRQELRLIDDQVQRIRLLVTKLLQFARPEEFAGYVEEVDVNAALEDCLVLVQHLLKSGTVHVTTGLQATHRVRISRTELQQVVINLLVNAIHAMPDGGVLTLTSEDWDDRGVTIHVRDTGIGIREEDLDRIFNPFYTTKKQHGTGLGLSISYALVERYDGRITVDSAPGKGADFCVWLVREPAFRHEVPFPSPGHPGS